MRDWLRYGLLALLVTGCSSESDGGAAPSWEPGQACPKDRLVLEGELGGAVVEVNVKQGAYEYNQGIDPKKLTAAVADGSLELTWTALLSVGQSGAANATLVLPKGAPEAGKSLCSGTASVTPLEHEWDFTLTDLAECSGGVPLGSLQGCLQTL